MTYPFSAGATLTAAGMNTIGLFHIKTQAVSGTPSSVTVTSAFSADYEIYRIVGYGLATSAAGNDVEMELGGGGSHTSNYYGSTTKRSYNAGAVFTNYQNTGPMPIAVDNTVGGAVTIDVTLYGPQVVGYTAWAQKGAGLRAYDVNGWYNAITQFTSVTFECTTGNWTAGQFRVYGVADGA